MLLRLSQIGKLYANRLVLKNVSLTISSGSVVLLVGSNGAGKTTLLKIMAGLTSPTAGVRECFCEAGGIGYLGHATFLYPGLSALENLSFWGKMHKRKAGKTHLMRILEQMELAHVAEEYAGTFSRGMAQRLNLARIILLEPQLLLLDEPGTGMDNRSLSFLFQTIHSARTQGSGIVWISHDILRDQKYADQIVALKNHTISYIGETNNFPMKDFVEEISAC